MLLTEPDFESRPLPRITTPSATEQKFLAEVAEAIDLHGEGRYWQAEKVYRRLLKKYPRNPRITAMLGLLLNQRSENDRHLRQMVEGADGDLTDVLLQSNLGGVLHTQGRITDAIEAYIRATEAAPHYAPSYAGLGSALADVHRHAESVYAYQRAVDVAPQEFNYHSDLIFTHDIADSATQDDAYNARRRVNDIFVKPLLAKAPTTWANDRNPDRKLRIGYVSADMYQHSGAMTWGGFVVNHDRKKNVEVYLYSGTQQEDQMTARFKRAADVWYDIKAWSDERLAEQIQKDQIDVLVDLASYSRGGRIPVFARRPAPIQVSGWGYATSTGLDCMDYFATDAIVVPPDQEGKYEEAPWRLPCALSWVPPKRDLIDSGHVPGMFRQNFTFGVFNRQPKITRSSIRVWAEILKRVPNSRLMIKNGRMEHEQVRDATYAAFREFGLEPEGRVGRFGGTDHFNHLASYWKCDVMLDPFPQGGGVSTFEALWMGKPVINLLGDRPSGRITASIMAQMDMDDWTCNDEQTYIERAVAAANDRAALIPITKTLRERLLAIPALDLKAYTAKVEAGYKEMWRRWLRTTEDASKCAA